MTITGVMGYRRRTGFLTGLTVAQISEFSLILAALGLGLGHIDDDTMGLITLVGLITIGTSTYLILYSHQIYERIGHLLTPFERGFDVEQHLQFESTFRPDFIVYGLGRYGGNMVEHLRARGYTILGVDFDPQVVDEWRKRGLVAQYGDAEDPEFPGTLPSAGTSWIVSTLPLEEANQALLHALDHHGYRCSVAVAAHRDDEAERLLRAGANLVFMPYADAAKEAADVLSERLGAPVPVTSDD
jgi:hypothetical protein